MARTKDGSRELGHKHTPTQNEGMPEVESELVPPSLSTSIVPEQVSQNKKRKRGPTKLKTIAITESSRIEVLFDEYGQPIGEGSVKLSSFYGPLVREIVPYTLKDWRYLPSGMAEVLWQSIKARFKLDKEWERDYLFKRMGALWRASKSRLVAYVRNAPNEEERLRLQPDNIKSVHDWKDFVKQKTSEKFKEKSDNFKEMRKIQMPHTLSRKGYARMTKEMKAKSSNPSSITRVKVWKRGHTKKDGTATNLKAAETLKKLENVERDTPDSSSTNLKEDALSKVLGPERHGRLRCFGNGVTLTKLAIFSQANSQMMQLMETQMVMNSRMTNMMNEIDE